jgi:hypothetical protein
MGKYDAVYFAEICECRKPKIRIKEGDSRFLRNGGIYLQN